MFSPRLSPWWLLLTPQSFTPSALWLLCSCPTPVLESEWGLPSSTCNRYDKVRYFLYSDSSVGRITVSFLIHISWLFDKCINAFHLLGLTKIIEIHFRLPRPTSVCVHLRLRLSLMQPTFRLLKRLFRVRISLTTGIAFALLPSDFLSHNKETSLWHFKFKSGFF